MNRESALERARRHYVTLVLPYLPDGSIDESAYRRLLRYFLESKLRDQLGFIVNADAGEIFYLTPDEKARVLRIALDEIAGAAPVYAGVFDVTTEGCKREADAAASAGVDGLFMIPPIGTGDVSFNWDPVRYPEYWLDQLAPIAQHTALPMIMHAVTARSPQWGIGIPGEAAETICRAVPNVVGWKMTYTYEGTRKMWKILRALTNPVAVLAASAHLYHEYLAHDMLDGTVSGSWNYGLEPMLDHIECWKHGDVPGARKIWYGGGLLALHDYVYSDYSRLHLRYKLAAWLRGLIPRYQMRAPLPDAKPEEITKLRTLLSAAGFEAIAGAA